MDRSQQISRNHQIRQSEQAEQLRGVLGQALVSGLAMLKQILDDMKRMLNPRTDLRLGSLERDHQVLQRSFLHRLDLSPPGSDVPLHGLARHFLALVDANVARVGEHLLFMPVQQGMSLRYIRHVGRRANHTVNQARVGVDANVGFHAKVPFVALLRLMHFRVTALPGILGRQK
jgi:hypothetical protein